MWRRCLMVVVTFCLLWGTPARAVARLWPIRPR